MISERLLKIIDKYTDATRDASYEYDEKTKTLRLSFIVGAWNDYAVYVENCYDDKSTVKNIKKAASEFDVDKYADYFYSFMNDIQEYDECYSDAVEVEEKLNKLVSMLPEIDGNSRVYSFERNQKNMIKLMLEEPNNKKKQKSK